MLFVDEKNAVLEHRLEVVVSSFLLSQGRFLSTKVEVSDKIIQKNNDDEKMKPLLRTTRLNITYS